MSNPIMSRIERDAKNRYAGFRDTTDRSHSAQSSYGGQQGYGQQGGGFGTLSGGYGQTQGTPTQGGYGQPQPGFPQQGGPGSGWGEGGGGDRPITFEDVMMRTAILFGAMLAAAIPAWFLAPTLGVAVWGLGLIGSLGITVYLMFSKRVVGPGVSLAYSVFQGLLVGAISRAYNVTFASNGDLLPAGAGAPITDSIVFQAILGTVCVFGSMLLLYKTGLIKVSKKFRSMVSMMVVGYFFFSLINLGYAFFTGTRFGIGGSGLLGIGISLFAVGLAAVMLTLDFDNIETAIQTGAPEKYSWMLAMGLLATLVWLYLEILRLLGRMRNN